MNSILLTNAYIKDYTGSEIDTVNIANYFISIGFNVDIFTIEKGFPLINEINPNIRLIDCLEDDKLYSEYDYIWSHHYPILDYLLFYKKIRAKYIHYVSLSAYANYEAFPDYYKELSLNSILSLEAKNQSSDEGYDVSNIMIFPNYIFEREIKENTRQYSNIKKVCVVSNHVPNELEELKVLFKEKNIIVDIFGKNHVYKKIDSNLLLNYDLVISIGKTINLATSLGIPCYVYDHFGGDGFLTSNNILYSFHYNFSGRFSKIKLSANELYQDIIDNYDNVLNELNYCKKFALDNYLFENLIKDTIDKIHKKPMNYDRLYKDYNYLFRKAPLFMITNVNRYSYYYYSNPMFQLYFSDDNQFWESQSIKFHVNENERFSFSKKFEKKQQVRIDLLNKSGFLIKYLKINNILISSLDDYLFQGIVVTENGLVTVNDDPWILLDNIEDINVEYEYHKLNNDFYQNILICNTSIYNHFYYYVKGKLFPKLILCLPMSVDLNKIIIRNNKGDNYTRYWVYYDTQKKEICIVLFTFGQKSLFIYEKYNNQEFLILSCKCKFNRLILKEIKI